jgi:hypothetical protein
MTVWSARTASFSIVNTLTPTNAVEDCCPAGCAAKANVASAAHAPGRIRCFLASNLHDIYDSLGNINRPRFAL